MLQEPWMLLEHLKNIYAIDLFFHLATGNTVVGPGIRVSDLYVTSTSVGSVYAPSFASNRKSVLTSG